MPGSVIQGYFPHGPRFAASRPAPLPPHLTRFPTAGGHLLAPAVRQRMEAAFHTNFADVRIHVGAHVSAMGAAAFTHGTHIHFAPGRYVPDSPAGQEILAHELAHVIQQRSGRVRNPFGSGIALVNDSRWELEARQMARQAMQLPAPRQLAARTVQRAALPALMSPEAAHAHACATHGTGMHGGTPFHLWGGQGHYVVDHEGERHFERYRDEIDRLGRANGCHTCGRFQGQDTPPNANTGQPMQHWVCDHQPPLGIIPEATEWHLYPQCHDCSNAQHGRSIVYRNSFHKHVGRYPDQRDQHLFWGAGRAHRPGADYGFDYRAAGQV